MIEYYNMSANLEDDYQDGLTGKGTRRLREDEVLKLLLHLSGRRTVAQSMEATLVTLDADVPLTEYSILGLESESEWGAHNDQEVSFALVKSKLAAAQKERHPLSYVLWFREF